jgi:uncharacterized protein YegJ (DUF2314 family)
MKAKYTLRNVVEASEQYPKTFFIPTMKERTAQKVGSLVKLIWYDENNQGGERMWVKITKCLPDYQYEGFLDNDPIIVKRLKFGQKISFGAEHISAIYSDRKDDADIIREIMEDGRGNLNVIQERIEENGKSE